MMIYETKNRILIIDDQEYHLTELEHKFLIPLSTGNSEKRDEICNHVYGCLNRQGLITLISGLLEKVKELKISKIYNWGYRLESDIRWI